MAASVRLTKNLPMTKGSPMSHYLAAKGSTAWEEAVKERKDNAEDDVPQGWRIVDKEKSTATSSIEASKGKKPTGRLFSFWSRRESSAHARSPSRTEEDTVHLSQSDGAGSVVDDAELRPSRHSRDSISSVRASMDKIPSLSAVASSSASAPIAESSSSAPTSLPVSSLVSPMSVPPVTSHPMSSYSDAPDLVPDPPQA